MNLYAYRTTGLVPWPLWPIHEGLGNFLNMVGTISTKNSHRDRLIVKTLLTGEAAWIIFPEGRMAVPQSHWRVYRGCTEKVLEGCKQ